MKKLKRAITKAIMAATLLFASCSPFSNQFLVYEEDKATFDDYIAVKAVLANYRAVKKDSQELHSSQSGARLIHPNLTSSEYDFYIYGQKSLNDIKNIIGPYDITYQLSSSGDSGKFEVNIPKGIWYMTLIAVKQNEAFTATDIPNVQNKALLAGSCMIDIQNSSSNTTFILSDAGLTTPGTIRMTLTPDEWQIPEGFTVKAGLYYIKSGIAVPNSEQNLEISNNTITSLYSPQNEGESVKINPGTYLFRLIFSDEKGNSWGWNDNIHIYPGREVDTQIYIPKIINEKPETPTGLSFKIDKDNNSKYDVNDESDYYSGTFNWNLPQNGTTATHYEVKIYEETGLDTYTLYRTFSKGVEVSTILYRSGSLDPTSNSLQLWLPLGKKLKAEFYAVNKTGNSDKIGITDINLYRVTYNLQGGSLQNDAVFGEGTAGRNGAVCRYGSIANPHNWINPGADDIKNTDNKSFDYWTTSPSENAPKLDTAENDGKYTGYENVELYANYKSSVTHPFKPTESDEDLGYSISIEYGDSRTKISDDGIITISQGRDISIFVSISGINYERLTFTLDNKSPVEMIYFPFWKAYKEDILKTNLSIGTHKIIIEAADRIGEEIEISQFTITVIVE